MNENDQLNSVLEKIQEIVKLSANGDYLYRGEPECYEKVSSGLYREYSDIEAENFDIEVVQKEILDAAKRYTTQTDDFEILTELQHYGYNTNLIDFTTNYNIALFFACDSSLDKDGRIILLQKTNPYLVEPQSPVNRVISQKSIFVRPPEGFIESAGTVIIPNNLKQPLMEYLRNCQDITAENIYNDLHGFIRYQNVHQSAYVEFYVGFTYQNEKDYSKAIKHYSNAIKLNPQMITAYANRGSTYGDNGNLEKAIKDFNKAIELKPDFAGAYYNRGRTYRRNGNLEKAIKDFNKAIGLEPGFAEAYTNRGNAYIEKGDLEKAIKDYDKAIKLEPDDATAYYNRGRTYRRNGDLEKAIKDYSKAIELKPDFAEAYDMRGIAYYEKGDYDWAIKDYDKVIELEPNNAKAYNIRGVTWLHLRKWDNANSDLTVASSKGLDIISVFREIHKNVAEFEQKYGVKLPEDIAAMLTQR